MSDSDNFGLCDVGIGREGIEGAEDGPRSTAVFGDILTGGSSSFGSCLGTCSGVGDVPTLSVMAWFFRHGQALGCAV
jgi:hypothetical protein